MTPAETIEKLHQLLAEHPPAPGGVVVASGNDAVAWIESQDAPPVVVFADAATGFRAVLLVTQPEP